jgi:hypothetical protein
VTRRPAVDRRNRAGDQQISETCAQRVVELLGLGQEDAKSVNRNDGEFAAKALRPLKGYVVETAIKMLSAGPALSISLCSEVPNPYRWSKKTPVNEMAAKML